jgi:hypothetical protein
VQRAVFAVVGVALWGIGLALFVGGSYVGGGALILAGGLLLVIAAAGGWGRFLDGLTSFLYFWR